MTQPKLERPSKAENIVISTYFEPEEIQRIRLEAGKRGLKVFYHPEWLNSAAFPAEHPHEVNLTSEQEKTWLEELRQADIMLDFETFTFFRWKEENLVPRLKWLQTTSAGVGQAIARAGLADTPLIVTTASGIHAVPLAEFVMMGVLMWIKQFPLTNLQQTKRVWQKYATDELPGKTMMVIGPGKIGREIARLAKAFGMKVNAVPSALEGRIPADYNADQLIGQDKPSLHRALAETDVLVLAMPHTPSTELMIGWEEIEVLKQGAFLVNIARGKVIDEKALIEALNKGRLSGAALDVFETEPLPPDSPLWGMENVVITPHSASTVYQENNRIIDIFVANLDLFLAGRESEMKNILDKKRLY